MKITPDKAEFAQDMERLAMDILAEIPGTTRGLSMDQLNTVIMAMTISAMRGYNQCLDRWSAKELELNEHLKRLTGGQ